MKSLAVLAVFMCLKSLVASADNHIRVFRAEVADQPWAEERLDLCLSAVDAGLLIAERTEKPYGKRSSIQVTQRYYLASNGQLVWRLTTSFNDRPRSPEEIIELSCHLAAPAVYEDGLYIRGTSP